MIKMLVTCPECEREISEYTVICPHCGFQGEYYDGNASNPVFIHGAGYYSPEKTEEREEWHRKWEKEEKEREEKAARLAAEEKHRAREREIEEAWKKKKEYELIGGIVMVIIIMGAVVGAVFGIRYIVLEIWRFVSALF